MTLSKFSFFILLIISIILVISPISLLFLKTKETNLLKYILTYTIEYNFIK